MFYTFYAVTVIYNKEMEATFKNNLLELKLGLRIYLISTLVLFFKFYETEPSPCNQLF